MWHIDEGALHAYLDGALDEYPAAEARRVREHLDTCAECATRLADERRVREDAQSILGLAAPHVEVPTFEELRAFVRAREPARTTVSVRLYRMGWAASVVLALGTGWLLRGGVPSTTRVPETGAVRAAPIGEVTRADAAAPSSEAQERANEVPAESERSAVPERGGGFADAAGASPGAATGSTGPVAQGAPAPALLSATDELRREAPAVLEEAAKAADDAAVDLVATRQQSAEPEPAAPPTAAGPTAAAADRARDADALARRAAPDQRLTSAVTAAPAVEPLGAPAAGGRAATADQPTDEDAVALVVPGLDVLDVFPVGQGTTFAGMRALQRLASGDTLEIVHLPESVDPTSLPPLREGWRELLLPRGSGWLVMRAPVPEATLLELLQRLEAGR